LIKKIVPQGSKPNYKMKTDDHFQILSNTFPFLTKQDIQQLLAISVYHCYPNRAILIQGGENAQRTFFILKGMVRGYFMNKKGEEKNIFLRPEHTFTGAPESLFQNLPTKYTFETILETHVLTFDYPAFIQLSQTNLKINDLYIKGLQENIQTLIGRVEMMIDKSPEERYEALLQQSPQFFQTAFNKHIANYLGITPVSLSRIIRRKLNA
jgi:CRP-like cAMP-binding protein